MTLTLPCPYHLLVTLSPRCSRVPFTPLIFSQVHVKYEDMWLKAFLKALHEGTKQMNLPDLSLDEVPLLPTLTLSP
jgi:hypothetical protein